MGILDNKCEFFDNNWVFFFQEFGIFQKRNWVFFPIKIKNYKVVLLTQLLNYFHWFLRQKLRCKDVQ